MQAESSTGCRLGVEPRGDRAGRKVLALEVESLLRLRLDITEGLEEPDAQSIELERVKDRVDRPPGPDRLERQVCGTGWQVEVEHEGVDAAIAQDAVEMLAQS